MIAMNTVFPYKTFGGWVRSFGIKVSDLTPEELEEAKEEFKILSDPDSGVMIEDSVLSHLRLDPSVK